MSIFLPTGIQRVRRAISISVTEAKGQLTDLEGTVKVPRQKLSLLQVDGTVTTERRLPSMGIDLEIITVTPASAALRKLASVGAGAYTGWLDLWRLLCI